MALLKEMTITNQYGKTSNIDQNTGEETSFVGQDDSFQYGNYMAVYGMKKVNSSSTPDEEISSTSMPTRVYVPQNLQIPQVGDKVFVIVEGVSSYMIGYLGGYDTEGGSSSESTTPISILIPNINGDYDINIGAIPEALNDKADRDLKNLDNTGTSKFQVPLVSGTNIKTINNNSILGSGDLTITASITGGASTIVNDNLTASKALISNSDGKVAVSSVTVTELGYLSGVTSAVQTQLNGKADTDLSNLSSTGEAKLKANIQLVNELPANPEQGVLYCIPEA